MLLNILSGIVVITNIGFTIGFDTDRMNPSWVAYDLEPHEVIKTPRKSFDFKDDPRIPEMDVSKPYKWRSQCFDRGHLAPAADFNWDTNALRQTYYFSNICPMTRRLNRGKWLETENECRKLAASGTVHLVIFPTYEQKISSSPGVENPSGFVKIAWGWFGLREWRLENKE